MNGKTSVVFFDLWQTLVHGLTTDPVFTLQKILSANEKSELDTEFLTTCLTTNIDRPWRFLTHVATRHGYSVTPTAVKSFRALLRQERAAATKYPETDEVLTQLKRCGYRLGIISNLWSFPVNHIFNCMGLSRHFEHCIYSFAVGERKPAPDIFLHACKQFRVKPRNCLMIGDSLASDVTGALNVGMEANWLVRSSEVVPSEPPSAPIIRSLRDLLP